MVILPSGRELSVINFCLAGTVMRLFLALFGMAEKVMVVVGTAFY
jgi:5-enolpyruvylshikimate-3-phosphate synthase